MHEVAWLLSTESSLPNSEAWTQANKVCRHTILTTLSNELFDVYCAYKEAKVIWESMLRKYTAKDVSNDIKLQINEYPKLLEELRAEKIKLPELFVARLLIKKLHD